MCSVVSKDADTQMAWWSGEGYLGTVVGIGILGDGALLLCFAVLGVQWGSHPDRTPEGL
jgi:hypothetical protein